MQEGTRDSPSFVHFFISSQSLLVVVWTHALAVVWKVVVWDRWGGVGASAGEMGDVGHLGAGGVQKPSLCSKQHWGRIRVLSQWTI